MEGGGVAGVEGGVVAGVEGASCLLKIEMILKWAEDVTVGEIVRTRPMILPHTEGI